ncbi:hypothetical protein KDA_63530 [Dictyobacter alpinus]|uniref:Uncharacterized protein n=2 Tax=Dictyobacter alpinus TaxID=2014873 RepID=A0A402BHR1_9CHLR|nr:hypothetical protein KDA_63530 [Dictyobacter alpinus]
MLKKDRSIWRMRLETLAAIACFSYLVINTYLLKQKDFVVGGIIYLVLAAYYIWLFSVREMYWQRLFQLRLDAAVHREQYLAHEQPTPSVTALSLPIKITLRPGKRLWILLAVLCGLPLLILTILAIFFSISGQLANVLSSFRWIGIILLVLVLYFLSDASNEFCPTISVNEQGMAVHYLLRRTFLPWSDARLFAYYDTYTNPLAKQRFRVYELSGEHAFIHWSWRMFFSYWWEVRVNGQGIASDKRAEFVEHFSQVVMGYTHLSLCELVVPTQKKHAWSMIC